MPPPPNPAGDGVRGMPSLLRSLLSDHLDPGYAAAAAARRRTGDARVPGRLWQGLAALLIAAVFALAVAAARSTAPGVSAAQRGLAAGVSSATVDRVLNRRLPVNNDTTQRVVAAAEALGRPHRVEDGGRAASQQTQGRRDRDRRRAA